MLNEPNIIEKCVSILNNKRDIYDKIISDGRYMLNRENTFDEDNPDEFVSEEVFDIASNVVSILVQHGFTDVEMGHCGNNIDIYGKKIGVAVSKESLGGFYRLKNYSQCGRNVVKFNLDIVDDWETTLNHIICGLGTLNYNENRKET